MSAGVTSLAGDRLKSFIERIERLTEEKRSIQGDIKGVYAEAKGTGFDTKIMRILIRERAMDRDELDELEDLLNVYRRALGQLSDTPLGDAAIDRAAASRAAPSRKKKGAGEEARP